MMLQYAASLPEHLPRPDREQHLSEALKSDKPSSLLRFAAVGVPEVRRSRSGCAPGLEV